MKNSRAPHTLNLHSQERNERPVVIEAFGGGHRVLKDGERQIEVIVGIHGDQANLQATREAAKK